MILSVTSKEEFPRRRRQVIIKKYIRQGIIWSDRRSPWRIKQSQFYKARSSLLGDRCDRNLKRKTKTKTNTKTKKQGKKQQQQKRLHYRDSVEFLSRISYVFLFLFFFCGIFLSNEDLIKCRIYFPIKHGFNEIWPCSKGKVVSSPQQSPTEKNTLLSL